MGPFRSVDAMPEIPAILFPEKFRKGIPLKWSDEGPHPKTGRFAKGSFHKACKL